MNQAPTERVDAIVVGANLCGLITAYLLDRLGFHVVVLERGARVGGANTSFTTSSGSTFDLGMHVLDYMRSEVTTRLFTEVIDGRVNKVQLKRGMVLRGDLVPYNLTPPEMPEALRAMLPGDELCDELRQGELPSRERLREAYGDYADFVFDEVLPSFRCELRHRQLGVDEALLTANLYPWFFPRATRRRVESAESRSFHDQLRRGDDQYLLYPEEGGFAGFANGFVSKLSPNVEILTNPADLKFEIDRETHGIRWIEADGRSLTSRHVFWSGRWSWLCELLDLPSQNLATDNVLLGSFRFDSEAKSAFNEILVADPTFEIDRISFPGKFAGTEAPVLQIEFAFPVADQSTPLDADHWRERWLGDLRRLGLVGENHQVVDFDFKRVRMHYNSFGAEGEARLEPDPSILHPSTNIRPVAPTNQNRNLNSSVPLYIDYVTRVLREHP